MDYYTKDKKIINWYMTLSEGELLHIKNKFKSQITDIVSDNLFKNLKNEHYNKLLNLLKIECTLINEIFEYREKEVLESIKKYKNKKTRKFI